MSNIGNEIQQVKERTEARSSLERILDKCKKREKKLIQQGFKWYKIGSITQVLIPCDSNGHPTEEGREKIQRIKKHLQI